MKHFFITIFCFLLLIIIVIIDYHTGYEFNFALFYIAPIVIMAWFTRSSESALFAVLAASCWMLIDFHSGHPYKNNFAILWNSTIRLAIFILISELTHRLKKMLDDEKNYSSHDALTQLLNRPAIERLIEIEINRLRRYGHHFTLIYIDLDRFKETNDNYGHITGDNILKAFAEVIQQTLRVTDKAARLGGDEFLILLPETTRMGARLLLKKLQVKIKNIAVKMQVPNAGISGGVFECDDDHYNVQELINNTDKLMYHEKKLKRQNEKKQRPSAKNS